MKRIYLIFTVIIIILTIAFLTVAIRGKAGNPIAYQSDYNTQLGGPFEASNSTSRYALTEAIVKTGTFFLILPLPNLVLRM